MTNNLRAPQTLTARGAAPNTPSHFMQRKCSCGTHTPSGGECAECAKRKLQKKLRVGAVNDPLEHEADRVADQVMRAPLSTTPITLQRASSSAIAVDSDVPDSVHKTLASPGRPLDQSLNTDMSRRFGHDFSHVRVHQEATAQKSASEVNARAYTVGHNMVFGSGEYAPSSASGRHLIAHELAHVAQQTGRAEASALYRKVNAVRFQDEPTLEEVSDGKKTLKPADHGEAVVRIIVALNQLGFYKSGSFDTKFGGQLLAAVTAFQKSEGMATKPAGIVDQATFVALDAKFSSGHNVDIATIAKVKAPNLLTDTQSIDSDERDAATRAMSTEPRINPVTGALPVFAPTIVGKGTYEDRLTKIVDGVIVAQFNQLGKGKAAIHANPTNLFDWGQIEIIAKESQKAVDKVFGEYTKGRAPPPATLKQGVNIFDAWEDKVAQAAAGGAAWEDDAVNWRVEKIITGNEDIAALDEEHGAVQTRAAEDVIIKKVQAAMVAKHRAKLVETHKGWPGFANSGKIFIQRFKGTALQNRRSMWKFFQTFIHEYIHTLAHANYSSFHASLGQKKGGFTLREGTTDYFTKLVWESITIDPALRKTIEGPFFDPVNVFAIQDLSTYPESINAERLSGIVGLRNLAAAFFLGKVQLIGKP